MGGRSTARRHRAAAEGGLSVRARVVWASLAVSCTAVTGLLTLVSGPGAAGAPGRSLTTMPLMRPSAPLGVASVFRTRTAIDQGRWTSIVVHHSGTMSESASSLDETHRRMGLASLGYHFVIGNGRRMGDGEIHVGARWLDQQPGAHVAGPAGVTLNRESIGICLVGDGDGRAFTELQMRRLVELVASLTRELGIDPDSVVLHRDVASTTSPGRFFPAEAFDRLIRAAE